MGEPKRDGKTIGKGTIGASAAVPGTLLEGVGAAEPAAEFCPTLLEEAVVGSVAGVMSAGAGAEEADCSDGGRLLDAVRGDSVLEACGDSLGGMSEGMTGLPPVVEADCKDVSKANGTPRVSVDLPMSAGIDAGTAGLEAGVLCIGTPEICGVATAVGTPAIAGVAGRGLNGKVSVGVAKGAIGIIVPVTIDANLTEEAGLLMQEGVP